MTWIQIQNIFDLSYNQHQNTIHIPLCLTQMQALQLLAFSLSLCNFHHWKYNRAVDFDYYLIHNHWSILILFNIVCYLLVLFLILPLNMPIFTINQTYYLIHLHYDNLFYWLLILLKRISLHFNFIYCVLHETYMCYQLCLFYAHVQHYFHLIRLSLNLVIYFYHMLLLFCLPFFNSIILSSYLFKISSFEIKSLLYLIILWFKLLVLLTIVYVAFQLQNIFHE